MLLIISTLRMFAFIDNKCHALITIYQIQFNGKNNKSCSYKNVIFTYISTISEYIIKNSTLD